MGLSAFYTFIQTTDLSAIETALQQVFVLDGFEPLLNPSAEQCKELDASQAFWGVFLHSAVSKDEKWSYVKCVPDDLLCQRSRGSLRPRLSEISCILQVDAFRFEVTDGDSTVLLECRRDGEFRVSGASMYILEEAFSEYEITEESESSGEDWSSVPIFFHEEQVQDDETAFELLIELQAFNNLFSSHSAEAAANEIEAEFLAKAADEYFDWIFYDRLYPPTSIDRSILDARELYFYRGS